MNEKYVEALRDAIQHMHGCAFRHVKPIHAKEVFQGNTVWERDVELFDLEGNPMANQCYAWGHQDDNLRWQHVAVLRVKGVDSALQAVRAYIVSQKNAI